MADLVAADVTITVEERWQTNRKRHSRVKIEFGDGAKTYPAGGVPMPAFSKFGLYRILDYLILVDAGSGQGIHWKYDKTNKKILGYEYDYAAGAEGAAIGLDAGSDAPAAQTLYAEAVGW